MGTIAQKLTYLDGTKTAIGAAIVEKGGSVTGKTFRQYANEISNLPSGGGGTPIAVANDVSDYTGGTAFDFLRQITDVNWPSGITSITFNSFQYCSGLTSISIPKSITTIGSNAFANCTHLTSVTIPNSVTSIGRTAFTACTDLRSITFPSSVTDIGISCFRFCSSLTSITVEATTPPTLGVSAFDSTNNCPIYVPAASVDTYKAASGWSDYASRIQAIPSE